VALSYFKATGLQRNSGCLSKEDSVKLALLILASLYAGAGLHAWGQRQGWIAAPITRTSHSIEVDPSQVRPVGALLTDADIAKLDAETLARQARGGGGGVDYDALAEQARTPVKEEPDAPLPPGYILIDPGQIHAERCRSIYQQLQTCLPR